MNKGFMVAILGVVLGAMVLIFLNQASSPVDSASVAEVSHTSAEPAPTSSQPSAVASSEPSAAAPAKETQPSRQTTAPTPKPVVKEQPKPASSQASAPQTSKPAPKPETSVAPAKPAQAATPKPATEAKATQVAQSGTKPAPAQQAKQPAPTQQAKQPAPAQQAKPVQVAKKGTLTLKNIGIHFRDNGLALRIEADGPFSYKSFVLPKPERYVVDLVGTWSGMRAPAVPSNLLVKSVRLGSQGSGPRLVLDMLQPLRKHDVVQVAPNILEFRIQ